MTVVNKLITIMYNFLSHVMQVFCCMEIWHIMRNLVFIACFVFRSVFITITGS